MSTLAVNAVTDANGGNTATINSMTPTADSLQGFRNRIINGDMRIDQRNAGASVTANDAVFPVDRFKFTMINPSKGTTQRSTVAPNGFTNSLLFTSSAATSVGAGDYYFVSQLIEGFNIADLGWGTADAKTVTLSFWVRSSLTGTFGGSLRNSTANRSYPFSYTISSANTFEYKTVTIAGDTSGTWLTDNSAGIRTEFSLGTGSTFSGTAGAWTGSNLVSATGATSVVGTNGATFYITGVQLEVGSVATPFERRDYGTELSLCQRYYYRITADNGSPFAGGYSQATTSFRLLVPFQTTMRTSPSALEQTGTAGNYQVFVAGNTVCNSVPTFINATAFASQVAFPVASGLTVGNGGQGRSAATGAFLGFSAEL
jgi:hypothetical protein